MDNTDNYIGLKGYTLKKSNLSITEQNKIKKELTVKPFVPKNSIQVSKEFPIYRESQSKLYVPRFYGIQNFGLPNKNLLNEGKNIDLEFKGELRDYQNKIIDCYLKESVKTGCGLLEVPCGRGKCHSVNTPIIMYDGSIKMVQDIEVGDLLMGDDSKPREVLSICKGREKMYKIKQENGDDYIVNESHILSLQYYFDDEYFEKFDINILFYLHLLKKNIKLNNLYGYRNKILFNEKSVKIEPYIYGYILFKSSILKNENNIIKYFKNNFIKLLNNKNYYHIEYDKKLILSKLFKNYQFNSLEIREKFLAGIIDSIGININRKYYIKKNKYTDKIKFIGNSIGLYCYYENNYLILNGKLINNLPVLSYFKKIDNNNVNTLLSKIEVEDQYIGDYYGFEITGNHRYMLGDCTITHNTVMGLNIISKIQKKTLIIVHKEFLLDQWIERIQQFLPSAKIGRIQGQKKDIKNKDIVIGMLQSLSMKDYDKELFQDFGLTIVDEVHHISAEVFCRSLFKIVTKYMLGLSATMNRKDGLSKVFKMFLGDIVYKEKRDSDDEVLVKVINFKDDDEDFSETIYNFKGQTHYSLMISKLCNYNIRSEFILKILKDLLDENIQQQIMILAHNKSLLKYFYDAIQIRNMASVGYYVGGMKKHQLKETENKKVVIATYAMAEEALDIKTLSCLIMATPRTDVTQAVGRILRIKHKEPLVIDIVDQHEIFQKQFLKRKKFYMKCKYKIIQTDNKKYFKNDWDTIYDNKKNIEKKTKHNGVLQGKCLIKINKNDFKNENLKI